MTINERIKALREAKRLSQYDMAEALNIGQSTYLQIEKGNTELTVKRLIQIADILGTSASELLEDKTSNIEVEHLQKEIETLKEDLKRDRNTIEVFNKLFDKITDSKLGKFGLALAAYASDPEGFKNKVAELEQENQEDFNYDSQTESKPPVSGLLKNLVFTPSTDKENG